MELTTARLLLRELDESDHPITNTWESDAETVRYQSHGVRSLDESRDYIRRVREESAEVPRRLYDLGVVRRSDGRLVGRAGLHVRNPAEREAVLWYVMHRETWGQGYAPEAAGALLELAFGSLNVHRVYADCDPRNHASARVAEKLGMRKEAHFVENAYVKGEWCDSLIYGLLDREWRARRD